MHCLKRGRIYYYNVMPVSTLLYNYFNQGRENLELSTALLNPYAKYMQSPNIPKNTKLPIAIDMLDSTRETDPTVEEWFQQLESNTRKTQLPVPLFFSSNFSHIKILFYRIQR